MDTKYIYRDIELGDFIPEYALLIQNLRALQAALLMLKGESMKDIKVLACHGDENLWTDAIGELVRLDFVREKEVH